MNKPLFTIEEITDIIKAFHLDSVGGAYNQNLLKWCNDWIKDNIIDEYK